jgi:DNA-binding NarL/FixJ family response regulator
MIEKPTKFIQGLNKRYQDLKNKIDPDIPDFGDKLDMYFTRREQEVLMLLAQGMSNDEIAKEFSVSIGTVGNLISKVKDKVEVENRNQLVLFSLAWTSKYKPVKRQD